MAAAVFNTAFRPINGMISVLAGYVMIISIVAYAVLGLRTRKLSVFVLFVAVLFYNMISFVFMGMVPSLEQYIQSAVMLVSLLLCLLKTPDQYRKSDIRFLFQCNLLLAMVFVLYAYLPVPFKYTRLNEYGYMGFTMGLGNTNSTSILVMGTIMLLVAEMRMGTSRMKKYLNTAVCVLLLGVLWRLESRTCILCIAIFLAGIFFYGKKRIPSKRIFWMAIGISFLSIAAHIWLASIGNIVIFGKPLASGRSALLESAIDQIEQMPWGYLLGRPDIHLFANYHNAPISLFCNIGLFGILLTYFLWSRLCSKIRCNIEKNHIALISYLGLIVFFIESSSEAGVMLGSVPYLVQIAILIKIGIDSEKKTISA